MFLSTHLDLEAHIEKTEYQTMVFYILYSSFAPIDFLFMNKWGNFSNVSRKSST